MYSPAFFTPKCDNHENKCASAVCLKDHIFMCCSCVIEKNHIEHKDCLIKDINELKFKKEKATVDILAAKQMLETWDMKTAEHKLFVGKHNDKIENDVDEFYNKLVRKLEEMKSKTLLTLQKLRYDVKEKTARRQEMTREFQKLLSVELNELDESNVTDVKGVIEEIVSKLNAMPLDEYNESKFVPSESLQRIVEGRDSFGQIAYADQIYDKVCDKGNASFSFLIQANNDNTSTNKDETDKAKSKESKKTRPDPPPRRFKKDDKGGYEKQGLNFERGHSERRQSDSRPVPAPRQRKPATLPRRSASLNEENVNSQEAPKETDNYLNQSEEKNLQDLVGQDETNVYACASYLQDSFKKLSPTEGFSEPLEITGLSVTVDNKLIVCIDAANEFVIAADIEGNINAKSKCSKALFITALGATNMAVLCGDELQLVIFALKDETLSITKKYEKITSSDEITGMDFEHSKKEFVLSCEKKIFIVSEKGKVRKIKETKSTGESLSQSILTKYDFSTKCLYILKIERKCIKCYSFKTKAFIWAFTYTEDDFLPRAVVSDGERLFALCKRSIVEINKETGATCQLQKRLGLPGDALSMCLCNKNGFKIAVVSNKSTDMQRSVTLGFVHV